LSAAATAAAQAADLGGVVAPTRWFVGGGHRRGTGSGSGRRRRSFPS